MANGEDIDPEIKNVRAYQAAQIPAFDVTRMAPSAGRALANQAALLLNDGSPHLSSVVTRSITGPGGALRVRTYTPEYAGPGVMLFIHGGGWFACNVDTHDRLMRELARASGRRVIGCDYRLAPECPYPAALDDIGAVWRWMLAEDERLEPGAIVVAGDSAGANLAFALAMSERDAGRSGPAGLALAYGCFAPGLVTASRARYGTGAYGLTGERMDWYWNNYLGELADAPPALAAPLGADLAGLPPVLLSIAECDVLADENRLLAERLGAAGVDVQANVWPGAVHGFLQMTRDTQIARDAVASLAAFANRALQ